MKISVCPLLAGALMAGVLWNAIPAHSQTENTAPLQARQAYEIPVKNVPAHLLAYWLDPTNQPTPAELGIPSPDEKMAPLTSGIITIPDHTAPVGSTPAHGPIIIAGIEKIVADDAQKKLLVFGEEAAVQKLRNTVAFLDRPMRQVELETHIVFMRPEDFQAFGFNFSPAPAGQQGQNALPPSSISLGHLPNNWATLLAERTRTGQTSELTVPRMTTYNNLSASLDIPRAHPVPPDVQDKVAGLLPQGGTNVPLELQTPLKIKLTPTINNDDTVTVLMDLKGQVQLAHKGASDALPLGKPSGITSVVNVRDGDTIALSGFDPNFTKTFLSPTTLQNVPMLGDIPIMGKLFNSKKTLSGEIVVFLTARIVRRVGE